MNNNQFPLDYDKMCDEQTNNEINNVKNECSARIMSIQKSLPQKEGDYAGGLPVIGIFIGCALCICTIVSGDSANSVGIGIVSLLAVILISFIIGSIMDKNVETTYKNALINSENQIEKEKRNLESEIQKIRLRGNQDKQSYLSQFELEAQRISVQLAESQLAKKVIEWMTDGFCRTIDAADRRKHIEQISVPFQFEVYTNKITCNLGTFDFEIERCENLNGPLEQTALARAIASSIQLNIVMKYPKDASGTDIQIKIEYQYTDKCPKTTITYVALNGNYEAVQKW